MAQLECELDTVVMESTLLTTLPYHFSKIMTMKSADIYICICCMFLYTSERLRNVLFCDIRIKHLSECKTCLSLL